MDCFNETLNSTQCNAASASVSGGCYTNNCDTSSLCSSSQCLPPLGNCSSGCFKCSATYKAVSSPSLTTEQCFEICVRTYGFIYSATNYGFNINTSS